MAAEIITKEDLQEFRELLLNDIKGLLAGHPRSRKTIKKLSGQEHAEYIARDLTNFTCQWHASL